VGEVLGRIDADSLLEPNWVEQVQQAFIDPNIAAVTGSVIYYDMPWSRFGLKADNAVRKLVMKWASPRYPFLFGSNMAVPGPRQSRVSPGQDEVDGVGGVAGVMS